MSGTGDDIGGSPVHDAEARTAIERVIDLAENGIDNFCMPGHGALAEIVGVNQAVFEQDQADLAAHGLPGVQYTAVPGNFT